MNSHWEVIKQCHFEYTIFHGEHSMVKCYDIPDWTEAVSLPSDIGN